MKTSAYLQMKISAYVQEIRPSWLFVSMIKAGSAMFLATNGTPYLLMFLLGLTLAALWQFAGVALNDYYDVEIDKLNAPERPLPSGRIGLREIKYFAATCIVLAVLISLLNPIVTVIGLGFILPLGWAYNRSLRKKHLFGPLAFSLQAGFGAIIAVALFVANAINELVILLAISMLACTFGDIILEGLVDIEGDRIMGKETVAIVFGIRAAVVLSFFFYLVSVLVPIGAILPRILPLWAFIIASIPLTFILIVFAYLTFKPSQSVFLRSKKALRPIMPLLCITFLTCLPSIFVWSFVLGLLGITTFAAMLEQRT